MHWVSSISTAPGFDTAVEEVSEAVTERLGGAAPDLALVFVSTEHRENFVKVPRQLSERLGGAMVLGCSAAGVFGEGREAERIPAISVTAANLPGIQVTPFHLRPEDVPPPGTSREDWDARLGLSRESTPHFIVLPDPTTCRPVDLVDALNTAYPGSTMVGGLTSGGDAPGQNALFSGQSAHGRGVVGVALAGNVEIDAVVAQGCRPIGQPLFVTRGERNVILELDGRNPADVLQELYRSLSAADQKLMQRSLTLGIVVSDAQEVYRQGDFLIRGVVGLDPQSGALAVGGPVRTNRVVQFHLRDAQTSADDLDAMLERYAVEERGTPAGALIFSCVGRGEQLYGEPHHDSKAFRRHIGPVPLGGFFCSGEIGPVQGQAYIHGFTSVFALFRRKRSN